MMQQVAKGLLEEAKGRRSAPSIPTAAMSSGSSQLAACSALLHFRSPTAATPLPLQHCLPPRSSRMCEALSPGSSKAKDLARVCLYCTTLSAAPHWQLHANLLWCTIDASLVSSASRKALNHPSHGWSRLNADLMQSSANCEFDWGVAGLLLCLPYRWLPSCPLRTQSQLWFECKLSSQSCLYRPWQ